MRRARPAGACSRLRWPAARRRRTEPSARSPRQARRFRRAATHTRLSRRRQRPRSLAVRRRQRGDQVRLLRRRAGGAERPARRARRARPALSQGLAALARLKSLTASSRPRFLKRVGVGPNATSSPASSRRRSRIASRMTATGARCTPMLRVEMKPGATVRYVRPGAISSRLWPARRAPADAGPGGSMWPEQAQATGRLRRERHRQVGIAAARRVVVDADSIEAGILAAGDERRPARARTGRPGREERRASRFRSPSANTARG